MPRPRLKLIVIATLAVAAVWTATRLPVGDATVALVAWIRDAGLAGVAVFALGYVVAAIALIPGSVLTLGAGFAYGPLVGTLIVSPVSVLAATVAFLLGRTVARDWIARRMAGVGRFAAVDEAIAREGFKIVLLLRLSPLFPFTLLNYGLGLTRVRVRDYIVASWIGMLPGTVLYVYLGSLLTSAGELLAGESAGDTTARQVLYWGGLAATITVVWLVTRVARRALGRSLGTTGRRPV